MASSKISVIIPVYKTERYLEKCVESVKNQTYKNIEIILVDDGSPDNCPALCDKIASCNDNIKVVHKENGGLSSARNAGIEVMSGEYVVFLDSDDTLIENAVELLLEKMLASSADAVFCDRYYQILESTGEKQLKFHFDETGYINNPVEFALEVMMGKGRAWRAHSLMYKSSVIKDNNIQFPFGYTSEDYPFNLEFLSYANRIDFLNEPTVNYLKREGSITTTFNKGYIDSIMYMDKISSEFLEKTQNDTPSGNEKRDSVFCRNIVSYLFSAMSPKNKDSFRNKKKYSDSILTADVLDRFSGKLSLPYFKSKFSVVFFEIQFVLLKFRMVTLAELFAYIAGLLKKIN